MQRDTGSDISGDASEKSPVHDRQIREQRWMLVTSIGQTQWRKVSLYHVTAMYGTVFETKDLTLRIII